MLEAGLFAGYLHGTISTAFVTDSGRDVTLLPSPPSSSERATTCRVNTHCAAGEISGGSFVAGISVFAGYALGESIDVGLRLVAAPSLAVGGVWGLGPALVFHPTEPLSIGVSGVFGNASMRANAQVTAPAGYRAEGNTFTQVEGDLAGGLGLGLEFGYRLAELGRGSVHATVSPFFLIGNGGAFTVPIGLSYRFQ